MLLRAAIATSDLIQARELSDTLIQIALAEHEISFSHDQDLEIDIAYYCEKWDAMLNALRELDIVFLSYEFLNQHMAQLSQVHQENPDCYSIVIGTPVWEICRYLALRPAGHLNTAADECSILRYCLECAKEQTESKHVLQLKTKRGNYAISADTIIYCQSDQKYVLLVTDSGQVYRKLGKLSALQPLLPQQFVRTHQSFLVNWDRVTGLDRTAWELILEDGSRIAVSRTYQQSVGERFQKFQYECQL